MSAGFLAMPGIIPFPPLGSVAGLGGLNAELIPFVLIEPDLIEGFEPNVVIAATALDGPKTALFATMSTPTVTARTFTPAAPTKRAPSVKVTITKKKS